MSNVAINIKGLLHLYYDGNQKFLLSVPELLIMMGEITCLVGESGSGKTTTQNKAGLLLAPCSGQSSTVQQFTITEHVAGHPDEFQEHDIVAMLREGQHGARKIDSLRRRMMGFYLQAGELIPTLTIKENVAMPMRLNGYSAREANERAEELLAYLLGVPAKSIPDKLALQFSGGQYQRVALARAIAHKPQILFVDEPTSSLDTSNKHRVLDLMAKLVRDEGATVVMVTHDTELARKYANYIIRFKTNPNGWGDLIPHVFRDSDGFGETHSFEACRGQMWTTTTSSWESTTPQMTEDRHVA